MPCWGNAYYNSLRLAHEKGITTVSFPSISTGAYRFPLEQAARIALTTVIECLETWPVFLEVRFVLFRSQGFGCVYENPGRAIGGKR
ncbi:MAG: macro domain-containing protein [Bacillota bacterium]